MDADKIIEDLNRMFAAPLPEFYKRRIIVWYDEEREFEDSLSDIVLTNARVVALNGTNNFEVKKIIAVDDTTSNILLYDPIAYSDLEDNWLLDVELYSEKFRADLLSMWMDEMGLPQTPALRKQVKAYKKYMNAKLRREKIAAQNKVPATPAQLHMAVMAAIAGIPNAEPGIIIKKVLCAETDASSNSIYTEFVNYGADKAFWNMVRQGTGYIEDNPNLMRLASHILITAATKAMQMEFIAEIDALISPPHQAYCYDFVSDWIHGEESNELKEIAGAIEDEMKLPQRFMKLKVADLVSTEVFPCINEVILRKLMTEIKDHIIDVETITAAVEKRRACVWYEQYRDFYEGIFQLANMQAFFKEHSADFHIVEPRKVWDAYTKTYYMMDTYYRLFHKSYANSLKIYHNTDLHDLFSHVKDKTEGLYCNWFLGQLGNNWSDVCADDLRDYGYIPEVLRQEDFYNSKVKTADSRVFVIISDAFRYEAAVSLTEQLRRETQCKVSISSMQAIFPTITKFGMAALLPHKELSAVIKSTTKTERLAVLADGQSTDSNNRERILKKQNPESIVLKYRDLLPMKRPERSALVKGKEVVYIYHNSVDHTSHNDETAVFDACDEAIDEIKNMVRIITNEFGGTHVYITADHGFLYTYSPLTEDNKVDKTTDSDVDVEYGRRYAIMQKGAKPEYLMPIKFLKGKSEFDAFAPRENIRIKMAGAGLNFVHGGISLQEMVVPLVDYHFLRNASKEYQRNRNRYDTKPVKISLLSASHKISNMIFSLNFYQTEAVGGNRKAATYQLYFTDSYGKKISDIQKIIADKTSDNGQDRTFRTSFYLKSLKYSNTETYYLVIADEDSLQVSKEEFQIDIAFAVDDFDFFN